MSTSIFNTRSTLYCTFDVVYTLCTWEASETKISQSHTVIVGKLSIYTIQLYTIWENSSQVSSTKVEVIVKITAPQNTNLQKELQTSHTNDFSWFYTLSSPILPFTSITLLSLMTLCLQLPEGSPLNPSIAPRCAVPLVARFAFTSYVTRYSFRRCPYFRC